jgi:hypothetical protein
MQIAVSTFSLLYGNEKAPARSRAHACGISQEGATDVNAAREVDPVGGLIELET